MFHLREAEFFLDIQLRVGAAEEEFAGDATVVEVDESRGTGGADRPDERDRHRLRDVEGVDEDFFAGLDAG